MFKSTDTILTSAGPLHPVTLTGTKSFPCAIRFFAASRDAQGAAGHPTSACLSAESTSNRTRMKMKMKTKNTIQVTTAFGLAMLLIAQTAQAGSHTWSGANSIYFNNQSNWSYGGAPTNGEQNVYLYFPVVATRYTCSNNISGLVVKSISFSGDNYTLQGKSITVTDNLISSGAANFVTAPIVLGGNVSVNVSNSQVLSMNSAISGSGNLTKIGGGTWYLYPSDANTYSGSTFVNEGTLQLGSGSGKASTIPGPLI